MAKKKRLLMMNFENFSLTYLAKDMCSFPYYLGKYFSWDCQYAYFSLSETHYDKFEKYCRLVYLGEEQEYRQRIRKAAVYIQSHIDELDYVCFFNYGGATYQLSRLAKSLKPSIKTYSKLDMSDSGFSHFYDGTFLRKIKVLPELWKSRCVDFFTVENRKFYDVLSRQRIFRGKIGYLPNAVSLFDIDSAQLDGIEKKNVIITVGRLGTHQKNNELLVEAMRIVDREKFSDWQVWFVGSDKRGFGRFLQDKIKDDPWLQRRLLMVGEITDRQKLYELYAQAKIICMTSRWESFGIATIEGMYFGDYPVMTNYGSIVDDITEHEKYATVVSREASPNELAQALEQAVSISSDERFKEIRNYARKKFDFQRLAGQLDQYLTNLNTQS